MSHPGLEDVPKVHGLPIWVVDHNEFSGEKTYSCAPRGPANIVCRGCLAKRVMRYCDGTEDPAFSYILCRFHQSNIDQRGFIGSHWAVDTGFFDTLDLARKACHEHDAKYGHIEGTGNDLVPKIASYSHGGDCKDGDTPEVIINGRDGLAESVYLCNCFGQFSNARGRLLPGRDTFLSAERSLANDRRGFAAQTRWLQRLETLMPKAPKLVAEFGYVLRMGSPQEIAAFDENLKSTLNFSWYYKDDPARSHQYG